jgi:hypothetical protein
VEIEQKLTDMGIILPDQATLIASHAAVGAHVQLSCKLSGNQLHCTEVPQVDGQPAHIGRLGDDLSIEQGYEAARVTAINALASMKEVIGDLDRIRQFPLMLAWVVCTPDFTDVPSVSNGATDLLVELYGDRGQHARATFGIQSLASGYCFEAYIIADIAE